MGTYIYNEDVEQWRPIAGYPDYEVSDRGNVRSFKNGGCKLLKPGKTPVGYYKVDLCTNKKTKTLLIHRLVAMAFIVNDDPIQKTQVNHISGLKTDNNVSNLEWVTRQSNVDHAWANGLCDNLRDLSTGENNGQCKLTDSQCSEIIEKYRAGGITQKVLGEIYGVSQMNISYIVNGKTRKRPTPINDPEPLAA